jgi:hypothetical protein
MLAEVEDVACRQHGGKAPHCDGCFELFFIFLEEVHDVSLVRSTVRI